MLVLTDYRRITQEIERLRRQLALLESRPAYRAEAAFAKEVKALVNSSGLSSRVAAQIAHDMAVRQANAPWEYRNPVSGESVVVTKRRRWHHPILRAWSKQYGRAQVASWGRSLPAAPTSPSEG